MHPAYPSIRFHLSRTLSLRLREAGAETAALANREPLLLHSPEPGSDFRLHVERPETRDRVAAVLDGHPDVARVTSLPAAVGVTVADPWLAARLLSCATELPRDPAPGGKASLAVAWPVRPLDAATTGRVERVRTAWASLLHALGITLGEAPDPGAASDAPAVVRSGGSDDPLTAPIRVPVGPATTPSGPLDADEHALALLRVAPSRKASPSGRGAALRDAIRRLGSMVRYVDRREPVIDPGLLLPLVAGDERSLVLRVLSSGEAVVGGARAGDPSRPVREAGLVLESLAAYYPGYRFMSADDDTERARAVLAAAVLGTARRQLRSVGVSLASRRNERGDA